VKTADGQKPVLKAAPIPAETDKIGSAIVDCAFRVHSELGPGLLENVYEICLWHEFGKRGLKVERQVVLPVKYDTIQFDEGYRLDLVVANSVIIEVKAVEEIHPVHRAQILTYLKFTKHRLGYLINFNVPVIKDGIRRIVL
jgi:GxxExxY protein